MRRMFFWGILALSVWARAAQAQAHIAVGNAAELNRAIAAARGGERIELAPSDYGRLQVAGSASRMRGFPSPVVIASADPARPAVFRQIEMRFVRNIRLVNIELRYQFQRDDKVTAKLFTIHNSEQVRVAHSKILGDAAFGAGPDADGFGSGIGLDVFASSDVRIEGNQFSNWHRGAVFHSSRDLVISGNAVSGLRSDGFDFAQVNNVVIEKNRMSNFRTSLKSGDHPDMIQFWTNRTNAPSTDITIRDNILDIGAGDLTQSIFMRNEEVDSRRAGPEMFYRNVTITGNVIRNSHVHGITVGETNGLVIANNTLIQAAESPRPRHVTVPGINVSKASENVRIENNVTPRIVDAGVGWTVRNNLRVQRNFPSTMDFAGNYFVDSLVTGEAELENFQFLPDAFPDGTPPGSPISRFNARPPQPRILIAATPLSVGRMAEIKLDVASVYGPAGKLDLAGATAEWSLGGGVSKQGLSVTHRFDAPGLQRPTVALTLRSGEKIVGARTILTE